MNRLSDSLTIGLVLALVFGALFFYLYTRLSQAEKRVSLTENILLDLKMATENTLMAMGSTGNFGLVMEQNQRSHEEEHEREMEMQEQQQDLRVEPISAPEPVDSSEVEQVPEEEFYRNVLQQTGVADVPPPVSSVDVNYESMTTKELKALAKQRGVAVPSSAHKREVIDALKRVNRLTVQEPLGGPVIQEGYPVESATEENRTAQQE